MILSPTLFVGALEKQLDAAFLNFIDIFVGVIRKVEPFHQIVFPGGC